MPDVDVRTSFFGLQAEVERQSTISFFGLQVETQNSTVTITAPTPVSGAIGASITITGTNFGASQAPGVLEFGGIPVTVDSWTDTSIAFTVPLGAVSSYLMVTNAGGATSNPWAFAIVAAAATSISGGRFSVLRVVRGLR